MLMKKNKHFVWMPLIGFDNEKKDKGVSEFINNAGFIPSGVSVFLFHPDIVNEHTDMTDEFVLHPDNCSYYGITRNEFRERQNWTNYDLRILAENLADNGIEAYLGIMGVYLEDTRHKEWQSNHRELLSIGVNGKMNLNPLKRFKDGTYYEDFFAEKVVKATVDYGFAGIHVSDFFCPPEHSIVNGDFSADMVEQFLLYSKLSLPDCINSRMSFDEKEDILARQEYIWNNLRRKWINFHVWRWEKFWTKICDALHNASKKVIVNNAWCSDPFEALYRYGIDYRKFYESGVDYIIAETVPTGQELFNKGFVRFNQYMSMAQVMSAYNPNKKLLTLLGVKDCTEEWDVLHHAPTRLERDMYALATLYKQVDGKFKNSTDGYVYTLGDGIVADEWEWIRERSDIAFSEVPQKILATSVVWSDNAHNELLNDYIKSRRPSLHKQMYELLNHNTSFGAVVRTDELENTNGAIFVPNFDLLSEEEKNKVVSYNKGAVICTVPLGYAKENIKYSLCFEDKFAQYKMCVFVLNVKNVEIVKTKIDEYFSIEEVVSELEGISEFWTDARFFKTSMPFRAMSDAFLNSLAYLINHINGDIFESDARILPVLLNNGKYRLFVFNFDNVYAGFKIFINKTFGKIEIVSKYPVIQPRPVYKVNPWAKKFDGAKAESIAIGLESDEIPSGFLAKVAPCGVSIFDVEIFE